MGLFYLRGARVLCTAYLFRWGNSPIHEMSAMGAVLQAHSLIDRAPRPPRPLLYHRRNHRTAGHRYPGIEGANGIADVLFGTVSPAGRTAVTWYNSTSSLPPLGYMGLYPNATARSNGYTCESIFDSQL